MSTEETDMTCYQPDLEHSSFDIPLEMANARIAALRGETRRSRLVTDEEPQAGAVRRLRLGLGRRLIAVGSALVAERRTHTLVR